MMAKCLGALPPLKTKLPYLNDLTGEGRKIFAKRLIKCEKENFFRRR